MRPKMHVSNFNYVAFVHQWIVYAYGSLYLMLDNMQNYVSHMFEFTFCRPSKGLGYIKDLTRRWACDQCDMKG